MTIDLLTILGTAIAFAGLCVTVWKIRKDDWAKIDSRIQSCTIELAAYKLHVAQQHPTSPEISRIETRLVEALDRLAGRIDRLLERDVK